LSEAQEERNKVLVRRFLEAQAKGDLDTVREMMAPTSSIILPETNNLTTARATCGYLPKNKPPSPTSATSSRIKSPKTIR
jgi:ketosteroid isomerase-like protein